MLGPKHFGGWLQQGFSLFITCALAESWRAFWAVLFGLLLLLKSR